MMHEWCHTSIFLLFLAHVCACRYLGEWVDASDDKHANFETQQKAAVRNCWIVAGVYLAMALVSAVGSCFYASRAKRS